jgi:D-3-phosphoglycerate dehydrogenase
MPSISAEEAPTLKPFVELAEKLGLFVGQLIRSALDEVIIEYEGEVADMNTRALTSAVLAGVLKPTLSEVNMVSAPVVARERGVKVTETKREQRGIYETYIRVIAKTGTSTRSVAGTIYSDGQMRLIQVKDINIDAQLSPHMVYTVNEDKPGFIGGLGTLLGEEGVNIASFHLGRDKAGGEAIALLEVDEKVPASVVEKLSAMPLVTYAKALEF